MPDQVFEQAYSMACRAARARLAAAVAMGALPRQDCEDLEQEALMAVGGRCNVRPFARFATDLRRNGCRREVRVSYAGAPLSARA